MTATIRFRVKKEVDTPTARKILSLKGSLIAQSYTDIIHFDDDGEEFYIHYFTTELSKREEVLSYIRQEIEGTALGEYIALVTPASQKV